MEDYPTANSDSKSEIRAAISTAWTMDIGQSQWPHAASGVNI